jgi:hypothetical protein
MNFTSVVIWELDHPGQPREIEITLRDGFPAILGFWTLV